MGGMKKAIFVISSLVEKEKKGVQHLGKKMGSKTRIAPQQQAEVGAWVLKYCSEDYTNLLPSTRDGQGGSEFETMREEIVVRVTA